MAVRWRHVSVSIARPTREVVDYVRDPAHLNAWAHGLGSGGSEVDGRWFVETSNGRVGIAFVPRNEHGVLDHDVTLPDGSTLRVPMRALPDGDGCEVVFHVQRAAGASDADHERDAELVAADLATLKQVLEAS